MKDKVQRYCKMFYINIRFIRYVRFDGNTRKIVRKTIDKLATYSAVTRKCFVKIVEDLI